MPLLSIIIPVYKVEKYLSQCIESIISQEFSDLEVILVDDGSPDNSGAICDEYAAKDSRVRVIHKENGGATVARLTAAQSAEGAYVLPVDSDDYLMPGFLNELAGAIIKYSPDIVCFGYERSAGEPVRCEPETRNKLYENETWHKEKSRLIYDSSRPDYNWGIAMYSLWSKAIKKELYLKYQQNVPKDVIKGEDLAVIAPALLEAEKVYFLDYCGYFYRDNETSVMNTFRERDMSLLMKLRSYLISVMNKENEHSINVFTVGSISEYVLNGARHFKTGAEFKSCMKKNITREMIDIIINTKINGISAKEKIKLKLITLKMYTALRIFLK